MFGRRELPDQVKHVASVIGEVTERNRGRRFIQKEVVIDLEILGCYRR